MGRRWTRIPKGATKVSGTITTPWRSEQTQWQSCTSPGHFCITCGLAIDALYQDLPDPSAYLEVCKRHGHSCQTCGRRLISHAQFGFQPCPSIESCQRRCSHTHYPDIQPQDRTVQPLPTKPTGRCLFLELPPELLDSILPLPAGEAYIFLPAINGIPAVRRLRSASSTVDISACAALAATCRAFHNFIVPHLYGRNTFVFHLSTHAFYPSLELRNFRALECSFRLCRLSPTALLGPLTARTAVHVRRVMLVISYPTITPATAPEIQDLESQVSLAATALRLANGRLKELRLSFKPARLQVTTVRAPYLSLESLDISLSTQRHGERVEVEFWRDPTEIEDGRFEVELGRAPASGRRRSGRGVGRVLESLRVVRGVEKVQIVGEVGEDCRRALLDAMIK